MCHSDGVGCYVHVYITEHAEQLLETFPAGSFLVRQAPPPWSLQDGQHIAHTWAQGRLFLSVRLLPSLKVYHLELEGGSGIAWRFKHYCVFRETVSTLVAEVRCHGSGMAVGTDDQRIQVGHVYV